jgi:hypothetical protein
LKKYALKLLEFLHAKRNSEINNTIAGVEVSILSIFCMFLDQLQMKDRTLVLYVPQGFLLQLLNDETRLATLPGQGSADFLKEKILSVGYLKFENKQEEKEFKNINTPRICLAWIIHYMRLTSDENLIKFLLSYYNNEHGNLELTIFMLNFARNKIMDGRFFNSLTNEDLCLLFDLSIKVFKESLLLLFQYQNSILLISDFFLGNLSFFFFICILLLFLIKLYELNLFICYIF